MRWSGEVISGFRSGHTMSNTIGMSTDQAPAPGASERRTSERFLYSKDQLLRRSPIYVRRRRDKQRLAAHLGGAGVLIALSVWWVIPLHSFAGPVLFTLTRTHGVHIGDLPTLVFLAVAGRWLVTAARLSQLGAPVR
jgi:hypothetical protein